MGFCALQGRLRAGKEKHFMNTEKTTNKPMNAREAGQLDLVKQIGKTTYKVKAHFSTTSQETMSDKINRMLRNEISQMHPHCE